MEHSPLRIVRFHDPHAFLQVAKRFDDSFMNFCIGSLSDYVAGHQDTDEKLSPSYLFGVLRGEDLL